MKEARWGKGPGELSEAARCQITKGPEDCGREALNRVLTVMPLEGWDQDPRVSVRK